MIRGVWAAIVFLTAAPLVAASVGPADREGGARDAQAHFEKGETAAARAAWEKALDGAKRAQQRRWKPAVARTYEAEGDYQRALQTFQEALDIDPQNVDRLADLGRMYRTVDLKERAIEVYERAHRLDRRRRDVLLALGETYFDVGRFIEAQRWADLALDRDARDPGVQRLLARLEESRGDWSSAARRREGLLAERPDRTEAVAVGRLWARAGETGLAKAAFDRAVVLGDTGVELAFEQAALAWRVKDLDAAQAGLKAVLDRAPDLPEARFLLSLLEWERGRHWTAATRLRDRPLDPAGPTGALAQRLLKELVGEKK